MKGRAAAVHALGGALLAATPLAAFLSTNGYPVATPEAGILLAGAAAAGALLGLTAALRTLFGALLLGAATALCIDFLYSAHFSNAALILLPATCIAVAVALRRHFALVVSVAASVFLAATYLVPPSTAYEAAQTARSSQPAAAMKTLPVLLHLVLDEHIGLDGLPAELPESAELRRSLAEGYVGDGFRVYAGAYSEYFETRYALANLLNFSSHGDRWLHLQRGRYNPYVLTASAYFRHLTGLGYRLKIYQSDHIDLCRIPGQAYAGCVQYRANSIGSLYGTPLATWERVRFIANSFLSTSKYLERLRAGYGRVRSALPQVPLPAWNYGVNRVGPLAVLPVVDLLEKDLSRAAPGEAYFAHLLIPHFPYMLDGSCAPRRKIEHWLYHIPLGASQRVNTVESRAARYRAYFAQIRCQQALLARLFAALKSARAWDNAIVVVQGDHGSRISRLFPAVRNEHRLTRADIHDTYSTLFAVRMPGVEAGVVSGSRPLQELLGATFGVPVAPLAPKVYLRAGDGRALAPRGIQVFR